MVPHYNLNGLLTQSTYPAIGSQSSMMPAPTFRGYCAALVTDYSSALFDGPYAGTPVIYAQFDQDEYARGHSAPSWFRTERDGFGPVCTTAVDVRATLQAYARRNFAREALVVREITALTSGDLALPDAAPRSMDR